MEKIAYPAGTEFGRLTILSPSATVNRRAMWRCECSCGNIVIVSGKYLRTKHTRSCGCLKIEAGSFINFVHGEARIKKLTHEYRAWRNMKNRCLNPKCDHWKYYGGRGIKVCQLWISDFTNFLKDMGRRPTSRHSIERLNTNGNYDPKNCVWATPQEQRNNPTNQKSTYICEECGDAFVRLQSIPHRFCSKLCRMKAYNRNNAENIRLYKSSWYRSKKEGM